MVRKLPKKPKPNELDSRLRGNGGILGCGYLSEMAVWKFTEAQKQRKPKKPDSRLWE